MFIRFEHHNFNGKASKGILETIQNYKDFLTDLIDLGILDFDALGSIGSLFEGNFKIMVPILKFISAIQSNLEAILERFPGFIPEKFEEMTHKIQEIVNNVNFEKWQEIFRIGKSCSHEVGVISSCIDQMKTIDIETVLENDGTNFDGIRNELAKSKSTIFLLIFMKFI